MTVWYNKLIKTKKKGSMKMARKYFAEWENVNEDSENYEDYGRATFSTFAEAKAWLGDKLDSPEYDCGVFTEDERHPGWFKVVLKGWLP